MLVLGIESSCDDTSVALVDCSPTGHVVISEKTASQIEIHKKYGGVVPEIAGRMHAEAIVPLIEEVLHVRNTNATKVRNEGELVKPDAIAVTAGPGLVTGLIVGVQAAQTLAYAWDIPIVATNHIEGHIHSVEISNDKFQMTNEAQSSNVKSNNLITFPALALVVSGGHTELILMRDHGDYTILGRTKDDAAGECFDKVAKLLDLPYPGGPKISKLAATGRTDAIDFPRPMLRDESYDFSFAGLKTSALYWLRDHSLLEECGPAGPGDVRDANIPLPPSRGDFCASFEQAITDVLVGKTLRAIKEYNPKCVVLGGGVAANKKLRESLALAIGPSALLLVPSLQYAMDNGAMIAVAGYYHAVKNEFTRWQDLYVDPQWQVDGKMAHFR